MRFRILSRVGSRYAHKESRNGDGDCAELTNQEPTSGAYATNIS